MSNKFKIIILNFR